MEHISNLIGKNRKTKRMKHILIIYILCEIIPLILLFAHLKTSIRRIQLADTQVALEIVQQQKVMGSILIIGSIIISTMLIIIFFGYYRKRLNEFKEQLHKAAGGNFKIINTTQNQDEFSELYDDLNIIIESIPKLIATVYEEQVQKEKLNSRQKDVEFKMLASQINPHFLYNTLETIRMKARCNGETEIEELVKMLAKIMRRNIQVGDKLVTLKSELELVEYYLKIQKYRFGDRVQYQIEQRCNNELLKIMPLIIQPIVENAFIHGLETKEGEGRIDIIVDNNEKLVIQVIDDGIGMSEEKVNEIKENMNDFGKLNHNNIGLINVHQRIRLLYGEEYGISIESEEQKGTRVTIVIPEDIRQ